MSVDRDHNVSIEKDRKTRALNKIVNGGCQTRPRSVEKDQQDQPGSQNASVDWNSNTSVEQDIKTRLVEWDHRA